MVKKYNLKIKREEKFEKIFKKLDNSYKTKVSKQIKKIIENPEIGKPMRHGRKGTREVYVSPYGLSYSFFISDDEDDRCKNVYKLIFLDLYHKDKQ